MDDKTPSTNIPNQDDSDDQSSGSLLSNAAPQGNVPRIFHIYYTNYHKNMSIQDSEKKPVFFIETSFKSNSPDVTFRSGPDKSAPIAAVCKFGIFSYDMKIGLGDPEDVNRV